jgi:nicotinate-nucleotide adenylyltransferase
MMQQKMKRGIFGGTFNPPHVGHLIVAEYVRAELSLDKIVFVPAAIPPHKLGQEIIPAEHRLAMLRLAVEGNNHFDVLDIELNRGGVSFTVDTLRQLREHDPANELYLLIGMDNLVDFHTWKSPQEILSLATVVEIEIASRETRARVAAGKSIRYLVPQSVEDYIEHHQLYRARLNA